MTVSVIVWVGEAKTMLYLAVARKYTIYQARSGKRGMELARQHGAAMVIVDAPSMRTTGERIIEQMSRSLSGVHVVLLSALQHMGAHALIVTPDVTPRTFLIRIKRLLTADAASGVGYGGIQLDVAANRLLLPGVQVALTPKQSRLFAVLLRHGGCVVTRAMLMKEVWDTDYLGDTRTLDVHIRWLRSKLDATAGAHRLRLVTVRGIGYCLELAGE